AFVRYNSRGDPGLLSLLPDNLRARIQIIPGDLRDLAALQAAMQGVSTVFHLGALISIPYSYLHPAEVVETNVIGTLNVLLSAQSSKVDRVVHTSTSEVYGTALQVPMDERHPLQGQSPYSASKIGADKLAESFRLSYDLPVVTVRPFNTFGPRQSARAVIPAMITQALTSDVLQLGNLDARRDFTYVHDTVRGFLLAAQTQGIDGMTFNLGSGQEIRISDLAEKILRLVGQSARIEVENQRLRPGNSEVQRLLADSSLAHQFLGWSPSTSLEDGLNATIAWIRQNLHRYRLGVYEF
ncbi:MAG: GDP-mannose 4,6-dehydratase, partial [Anaerolineales bacterium]|nr:GDP-mannose 4,6-dehydratase [Anaerolineales bacterium]